jgi:hypothetical protein
MKATINDFFDYCNEDGTIQVSQYNENITNSNKLYVLNGYGKKIVQLIINEESNTNGEKFAQIKIIPYGIKKVLDTSSLTQTFKRFKNAEITYHGSSDIERSSKIHLKYLEDKKYKTIIDKACKIKEKEDQLIPLFSINVGNLYNNKKADSLKKKNLKYQMRTKDTPITLDFYIAGNSFSYEQYMNSIYSFNMFFSMDYLDAQNRYPLYQSLIMQPIEYFAIKGYKLFVRATFGENKNDPYFVFYNNNNFYDAFLYRDMMYVNKDGSVSKAINMKDKEKELNQWYKDDKAKINKNTNETDGILISKSVK